MQEAKTRQKNEKKYSENKYLAHKNAMLKINRMNHRTQNGRSARLGILN
jgi:ribosomal protein S5